MLLPFTSDRLDRLLMFNVKIVFTSLLAGSKSFIRGINICSPDCKSDALAVTHLWHPGCRARRAGIRPGARCRRRFPGSQRSRCRPGTHGARGGAVGTSSSPWTSRCECRWKRTARGLADGRRGGVSSDTHRHTSLWLHVLAGSRCWAC